MHWVDQKNLKFCLTLVMMELAPSFDLELGTAVVGVTEHELMGKRVFHIDFKAAKAPLVIVVALNARDEKFWTSIPKGRQQEAKQIGKLIANHIGGKPKNGPLIFFKVTTFFRSKSISFRSSVYSAAVSHCRCLA
jgi:hypothetical protein